MEYWLSDYSLKKGRLDTIKKNVLLFISIIIVLVTVFYFWGSASNFNRSEYNDITVFKTDKLPLLHDTLSILTYNLGYLSGMTNNLPMMRSEKLFSDNLKNTSHLFSDIQPDFIGFQEIDFKAKRSFEVNQMKEIANASGYNYVAKAVNWDKKYVPFPYGMPNVNFGQIYSGQAIVSKFPILSNELKILRKPESHPFYYSAFYLDRIAQIDAIDINGKKLILINVHLEAFDVPTREKQAETLVKIYQEYADDYPVLLFGDFNSTPPNATHLYEDETTMNLIYSIPGIKSAISDSLYLSDEKSYFTFNSENPQIKIDYIFYNSDKIEAINGRVVLEAEEISDHLPVMMRFVLK
jgi:endonuclease/exonuclease/phosphatase family metal-dependent hydrolase